VRINYFSDIHLEFGGLDVPDNDADLIVAAGDIGLFNQGIEWLKSLKKPVIYVAGNHEFYLHDYHETLAMLHAESAGSNVCFLENEQVVFQNVRFLGCTLWTDVFVEGEARAQAIGEVVNDFRRITYHDEPFNQYLSLQVHQESRLWLERQLAQPFAGKTVVITHHAPIEWAWTGVELRAEQPISWLEKALAQSPLAKDISHPGHSPEEPESLIELKKLAYCNDLNSLFYHYKIDAWIYGHVHCTGDWKIFKSRIVSNPRGYFGKKLVEEFDINRIIEI
jgi:predicted phosphodiesterase